MPKISVIVPVYNAEKYLHRCIDSILAQTFTDFELLLIDDGSKDHSGSICDEYAKKDSRVRVFHKENGGVSSARNVGLDNAEGVWITFCDSDDWVDCHWLETYNDMLKTKAELYSQGYYFSTPENRNDFQQVGINNYDKTDSCLLRMCEQPIIGFLWHKLFKTCIIKNSRIRFNEEFAVREDYDFILKYCLQSNRILCISDSHYKYEKPNYTNKYKNQSLFEANCSIFMSLREIYNDNRNILFDRIYNEINNSLFASYKSNTCTMGRLLLYIKTIRGVELLSSLSIATRLVLRTRNISFIHFFLKTKSKL